MLLQCLALAMAVKLARPGISCALLALAACSEPGGSAVAADDRPVFLLDIGSAPRPIDLHAIPYPNDILRGEDGRIHVAPQALGEHAGNPGTASAIADALAASDGFGVTTGALFPLAGMAADDALDLGTIDAELIDLEGGPAIAVEAQASPRGAQLYLRPRAPVLAQGHTFAYVIYDGATTRSGRRVEVDATLGQLLAAGATGRGAAAYAPLARTLERGGLRGRRVIAATVFTTAVHHRALTAARRALQEATRPIAIVERIAATSAELDDLLGAPSAVGPGWNDHGTLAHAHLSQVVFGSFDSPTFRAPNGRWVLDASGAPIVQGLERIPFVLAIPTSHAAKVPVILFAHGMGGSRSSVLAVADTFAEAGYATIGIDLPFHGDRQRDGAQDDLHNVTGAPGGDGLADDVALGVVTTFLDALGDASRGIAPLDPAVIAANFRQGAIDLMALVRLLKKGDWSRVTSRIPGLSFDAERPVLCGHSLGAMAGEIALTFEPDLEVGFLSGAGGGLIVRLLESSPTFWPFFGVLAGGVLGMKPGEMDALSDPPHTHLAFLVFQSLIEAGDPLTYAPLTLRQRFPGAPGRPRHVVLLSPWADEVIPNQAQEALAAGLGLELARMPASSPGPRFVDTMVERPAPAGGNLSMDGTPVTGLFLQVRDATHGMLVRQREERVFDATFPPFVELATPVPVENPTAALQRMVVRFADAYRAGGMPMLVDTFAAGRSR